MPARHPHTADQEADFSTTQGLENPVSWFGETELQAQRTHARPLAGIHSPAFSRLLKAFLAARVLLGLSLLGGIGASLYADRTVEAIAAVASLLYALLCMVWWWLPTQPSTASASRQGLRLHVSSVQITLSAVIMDLLFFWALPQMQPGFNANTTALMALPVLMAAVLLRRFAAVATAAGATLLLLAEAVFNGWSGMRWDVSMTSAGVSGMGFFAMTLVVSELAQRLSSEQRSAQDHMDIARQQAQLNRLVIEEMPEGVLVIDRQGNVRSANPSARRLLAAQGQTGPAPFQLRGVPAWSPLVEAIERAFASHGMDMKPQNVMITFDDQMRRGLNMRLKFTQRHQQPDSDEVCVVLLEDLRQINARARQDKLAAMGRMSAALAHEIRNPLAAISQANALMAEDAITPEQQKLTTMVADNVQRLKQIVDDVMTVSPGSRDAAPMIDIRRALRDIVEQWSALHPDIHRRQRLKLELNGLPPPELNTRLMVRFDPEHLRRVLVNLLDNASRHGSDNPQAIVVRAQCLGSPPQPVQVMLSVLSDGPRIEANVEAALFEPFFSTRSRGTGLGLYICRELCEQHGASMEYRSHPPTQRHRNEFYLMMPMADLATDTP